MGRAAIVLVVAALVPREVAAQSIESPRQMSLRQSINLAADQACLPAGQSSAAGPRTSRRALWIGLGAGFAGGMVFGEYYFGRHLDLPHGPDMLIGGAIGAGAGALIARLVTGGRSTPPTAMISPVLTPHTKALSVTVPIGPHTLGRANRQRTSAEAGWGWPGAW